MKRTNEIYGIGATFETPNSIIKAAERVSGSGYKHFDVHTPYPLHGMDNAMRLKPSKLGYITLVFGLSGAAIALLSMYWVMAVSYPMVIGGKPLFALPAFIPVTFEVTVLLATLSTVIGMITFFFKFPFNAHPLNDTAYMKAASGNKFGVFIEAKDPKFSVSSVERMFKELNPVSIERIFNVQKESYPILSPKFAAILVFVALLVSGGTYVTLNKLLYIVPFDWMVKQPKLSAQAYSAMFGDSFGMRNPVEGTVANGFIPYEYKEMKKEQPATPLSNPLTATPEILKTGKKKFLTFCSPCHGNYGEGDSRMGIDAIKGLTLHSDKVKKWEDGNIYHVLSVGQNNMPSYSAQLTQNEMWSVILYVRALQKAKNASESDIQEIKKETNANVK